jgi:hypothetical protein
MRWPFLTSDNVRGRAPPFKGRPMPTRETLGAFVLQMTANGRGSGTGCKEKETDYCADGRGDLGVQGALSFAVTTSTVPSRKALVSRLDRR